MGKPPNSSSPFLTAIGIVVVIGIIIFIAVAVSRSRLDPSAPQPTVTESEDCDREDIAKRDVEDCGVGVLLIPKTSAPAKKSTPKPTRTR